MKAMLLTALLCAPLAAHAVFKCRDADGKVVYSDTPCAASQESLKVSGMPMKAQPERAAASAPPPSKVLESAPPATGGRPLAPAPIDFGKTPETRLTSVVALLDSLALDGRDCESSLKADARKITPCATFATHVGPGREWPQALGEVYALMKEPGLYERRRSDFMKASGLIERISGHLRFMEGKLTTRN